MPKDRELRHFTKPRDKAYVIVKEHDDAGKVTYRTPPLHAPVKLAPEKKK